MDKKDIAAGNRTDVKRKMNSGNNGIVGFGELVTRNGFVTRTSDGALIGIWSKMDPGATHDHSENHLFCNFLDVLVNLFGNLSSSLICNSNNIFAFYN